ncbi:MFS transporter [Mesorhizobium sp. LHD-90]|uniref:MFS transporter n=1 Tax=Mesorhizobium sp. LHD-90 TaxID=3071414 RepID=UPI0027E0D1E4|nr:MFS transporter [Mesorhizobium sp. LHD-90]MDQ6432696.1 MFS transporter [Mesorhizobium sp. LHD-90]
MTAAHSRSLTITALGITQILAWGSSFYLPAVLAKPIAAETGWPLAWVVGGLSVGLLTSGLVSTLTGNAIQRWGGRPILVAGALFLALGQATMAAAPHLGVFLFAWVLMGLGMSGGLYDAGFGTLGRLYGNEARSAITALTLWGGFASTLCWPLSALLVENYGWRVTCLVYAGIQIVVSLPCFLLFVPNPARPAATQQAPRRTATIGRSYRPAFVLLAAITTLAAMIASMLSVHLLTVLQLRGIDLAAAVGLGALIGPSQVGARLVEMLFGRHHHPIWVMIASVLLLALGIGLLLSNLPITAMALVLYGAGNGVHTIARGALPLVLFDPQRYAAVMGRLAPPSLVVQATAPALGAVLLDHGGSAAMLSTLFAAAVLNLFLTWGLWLVSRRPA